MSILPPPDKTVFGGIDVGGTNLRFGLIDSYNNIVYRENQPTVPLLGKQSFIERLSAGIERLKIQAYSDNRYENQVGAPFEATINPETYTTRHRVEFSDTQAPGTSMPVLKFNKIPAQEITFNFLFDSTGVIRDATPLSIGITLPGATTKTVTDEIDAFKKYIIDYSSQIHRPYFLKIHWGTLLFKCVLTSMDIEYKLFKPDGTPVRAVARCTFKGSVEEDLRKALENKQSPDITHVRIVNKGDRLSLMTYKIYRNQRHMLQVAAFNHLDGFRNITPGTRISFPPEEK